MKTSMRPLLKAAEKYNYAHGAFNVNSLRQMEAAFKIHELFSAPMILQGAELANSFMSGKKDFKSGTFQDIEAGMKIMAEHFTKLAEKSNVPAVLHLDHGSSFEICRAAIDAGYSSVMIDGSSLPLEENIALTKRVVEYAHARGVSVEGELGVLSGVEDHVFSESSSYTNPLDAVKFVRETGADALAISYGTSHGANKGKSVVLRKEIAIAVDECLKHEGLSCYLVSHGSSNVEPWLVDEVNELGAELSDAGGIPIEQLKEVIKSGIRKINVDTDIRLMTLRNVRKLLKSKPTLLGDEYINRIAGRLSERPEVFDPRYFLQDIIDAMTKGEKLSDGADEIMNEVEKALMETCGRLIVEFQTFEKASKVEYKDIDDMKKEYDKI